MRAPIHPTRLLATLLTVPEAALYTALATAFSIALAGAPAAAAAQCDTVVSRTSAAALTGMRIHSVVVRALPPATVPGAAGRLAAHLHRTTRAATVLRDFPLAPGDTVDTLIVAESMRRLRQRVYLADAEVTGARCTAGGPVDLTVVTWDKWSLNPTFAAQSGSSYGGLEERNVLGSGRAATVSVASREGRIGGALAYTDPYLLNLPIFVRARAAQYGDGDEIRARIRNAEQSVQDAWRFQLSVARYRRDTQREQPFAGTSVLVEQAFSRQGATLTIGRRIGAVTTSANFILFGLDFERASLNAPDNSLTVGPKLVQRRFHGPSLGMARRAAVFDTVGWFTAHQALIDVPVGVEMEGMLSAGREDVTRHAAAYGSIWIGKMWIPGAEQLASIDAWASGYRIGSRENFDAASNRALASYYARRGSALYSAHVGVEKLVNPDPDVRALQTFDPTLPLIPAVYRLSENAAAAEVERASHVWSPVRSLNVDGALFSAASYRTASAVSQHDHLGVVAIGAGLRLVPAAQGSGSLRLDLLYPVLRSSQARHGFTFAVSVTPWLQSNRQREDPRLR